MPRKLTLDEFLLRCKEKHGNRYDYSLVDKYEGFCAKVTIICSVHGKFEQGAGLHMGGSHCQECAKIICANFHRSSTDDFILKAKRVHGDKYTYGSTLYSGVNSKVLILCPRHGLFEQTACVHLNGCGCKKCGIESSTSTNTPKIDFPSKLTTEDVISKIRDIHGDRYDLSHVDYENSKTKIKLICCIHGEFFILPKNVYLQKQGCHACGRLSSSHKMTIAQVDVIKRFQEAHGGLYDYSQVVYTGVTNKVKIICSVHGPFWQQPNIHMDGHGCAACGNNVPYTADTFAQRAAVLHSDKYRYEKVLYKNNTTHVTITCPEHGDFEQLPLSHLVGKGCWKCRTLGYSKQQIAWLEWRSVRDGVYIQHALNDGEHRIANSAYRADGYAAASHTVYELASTWWHGGPLSPSHLTVHPIRKVPFSQLYEATLRRDKHILAQGYKLVTMWDHEWLAVVRAIKKIQRAWRSYQSRASSDCSGSSRALQPFRRVKKLHSSRILRIP